MSSPKISIVIPVYNTEKFIDTCLESCITQTMKDIEMTALRITQCPLQRTLQKMIPE